MRLNTEKAIEIIDEICTGSSLRSTLAKHQIPIPSFFEFVNSNASLANRYARAQQARSELLVEEIVEIADNEPDAQRARVRTEARRWYASKMQPQKYGERIDLNISSVVDISGALTEAKRRALPASYQHVEYQTQSVESKEFRLPLPTGLESVAVDSKEPSEVGGEITSEDIFS